MEQQETPEESPQATITTTLNRGWVIKLGVIGAVLGALGLYGLYDATVAYPARGARHAEFAEFQYLAAASDAAELPRADVREPTKAFEELRRQERTLSSELGSLTEGSLAFKRANVTLARYTWLYALRLIGRLDEEHTTFADARGRLGELEQQWQVGGTPKPLKAYDIPLQWAFCIFGLVGALWVGVTFVRTKSKVFTFESQALRLTLPGGVSFTPTDIEELDKRRWHKFFVAVKLKEGATHQLDLLRYAGLEDWILEMEKHTEGYVPDEDDSGAAESSSLQERAQAAPETTD